MSTIVLRFLLLLATAACLVPGCGDDNDDDDGHDESAGHDGEEGHDETDGGGEHPDCAAITAACHEPDDGAPGDINTCHSQIAHRNDPEECAAEKERCISLCEAALADGGAPGHED